MRGARGGAGWCGLKQLDQTKYSTRVYLKRERGEGKAGAMSRKKEKEKEKEKAAPFMCMIIQITGGLGGPIEFWVHGGRCLGNRSKPAGLH